MFCPSCKDEFRSGFTRCASCDVDLVDSLDVGAADEVRAIPEAASLETVVSLRDYCGFFDLDEARGARERLRAVEIRSEIAIRDMPGSDPVQEEYWLRIDAAQIRQAEAHLDAEPGSADDDTVKCSECGTAVSPEETFCFSCGARFVSE